MGGSNGSTLCATLLANKHQIFWYTKEGIQQPNCIGSVLRTSTVRLGSDPETAKEIHVTICDVLPMVHPNDLVLGGWDISSMPMDKAMERARVLDYDLQRQVRPYMALLGSPLLSRLHCRQPRGPLTTLFPEITSNISVPTSVASKPRIIVTVSLYSGLLTRSVTVTSSLV